MKTLGFLSFSHSSRSPVLIISTKSLTWSLHNNSLILTYLILRLLGSGFCSNNSRLQLSQLKYKIYKFSSIDIFLFGDSWLNFAIRRHSKLFSLSKQLTHSFYHLSYRHDFQILHPSLSFLLSPVSI